VAVQQDDRRPTARVAAAAPVQAHPVGDRQVPLVESVEHDTIIADARRLPF
jgi:hypothetical protein